LVASYRRAGVVGRAARSVLAQSDGDFELVIVDDGSDDGTREVVAGLGDGRVRYIAHESNRGVAAAFNTAIAAARGRYVVFLGSDDELTEHALATMRRAWVAETHPDVREQVFRLADASSGELLGELEGDAVLVTYEDLLCGRNGSGGDFSGAHRRELFPDPPFDPGLRGFEGLTWLALRRQWPSRFHQAVVYKVHRENSAQRLSGVEARIRNASSLATGYTRLLSEHADALYRACPDVMAATVSRAALYCVLAGRREEAAQITRSALRSIGLKRAILPALVVLAAGRRGTVAALRLHARLRPV
jgi:glycosyltransferase involved in cell wall biosynthesis